MPRRSPARRHALWPPTGDRRSSSAPPLDVTEPLAAVLARADRAEPRVPHLCSSRAGGTRKCQMEGKRVLVGLGTLLLSCMPTL
uniref:Uncharacterized protein n=1 Tax=Oryza meridionalis TaxID=40149 RepID=A0A0E0E1U5_9ORYZ